MKARPRSTPDAPLALYNRKRKFDVTSEPAGELMASAGNSFVVQKHDATRLHYDFRLELDGVLKSWAVPKGPSLAPGDKRLAMETEDHPVSYGDFEGVIPAGEYGAGPVIVWDRGTWEPLDDPRKGLAKGALKFRLHGEKLRGTFSLVRLKGDARNSGKPWLLIKRSDEDAPPGGKADADVTKRLPQSVLTGRTIEDVAAGKRSSSHRRRARSSATAPARPPVGAPHGRDRLPSFASIAPQLATLVTHPRPGVDYLYEIKFDGYRALAYVDRKKGARLCTRNGLDWTDRFPSIADALATLGADAVLDGEICYVLDDGRTDFQHLQNALRVPAGAGERARIVYFVFDLLYANGTDLRAQPLRERKALLEPLVGARAGAVRYSGHLDGDWRTTLTQACALGLEGVIGKRAERPYVSGRGADWIKLKCNKRQEFVIVGMTAPEGSRHGFGSLLLAVMEPAGLRYAGKVGTGFSDRSLKELHQRLTKLTVETPPLAKAPRLRNVRWVRPELVCEVSFTEFTRDGSLRHPSFEGLREDKPATQVAREEPVPPGARAKAKRSQRTRAVRAATTTGGSNGNEKLVVGGVRISHPERVMDVPSGTTKGDLARYHEAVSALLMPYADHRPLALVRCPQGSAQKCFFQKQATAGFSEAIRRKTIDGNETLHVTEPRGLFELAQFNVVEFHGWGAKLPAWNKPDWVVIDFDPDVDLPFKRVVDAAHEMRQILQTLNLRSFVKTTGGKGLHVVVPLMPRLDWDPIKAFTRGIAEELARRKPSEFLATATKSARKGRIFVDWLRNARGATAILPYSPRARPGATVAMPVAWKDLAHLDPREFTVATVPGLLRRRRKDPWAKFFETRQDISERLGIGTIE